MRTDADPVYARIYATVDSVPKGRVATYGQIAEEAGLPRRARLVGRALRILPDGTRVPWHRIVSASGQIPDRGPGTLKRHAARLKREAVAVDARGRVDLKRYRWQPDEEDAGAPRDGSKTSLKASRSRSRSTR